MSRMISTTVKQWFSTLGNQELDTIAERYDEFSCQKNGVYIVLVDLDNNVLSAHRL